MNPIKHVAIIMDGNGRWGIKHKKSRNLGHKEGLLTVENIVDNDPTFKFTVGEILRGNTSGAQADVISVEYTTFIRNEDD